MRAVGTIALMACFRGHRRCSIRKKKGLVFYNQLMRRYYGGIKIIQTALVAGRNSGQLFPRSKTFTRKEILAFKKHPIVGQNSKLDMACRPTRAYARDRSMHLGRSLDLTE